jgi:hypothetical protein
VPALPALLRVTCWRVVAGAPCGLLTIDSLAGHSAVTLASEVDMSVVSALRELPPERES